MSNQPKESSAIPVSFRSGAVRLLGDGPDAMVFVESAPSQREKEKVAHG